MKTDKFYLESITNHRVGNVDIRIWRKEKPGFKLSETISILVKIIENVKLSETLEDIAKTIAFGDENINAIEIKLKYGIRQGIVLYKNWP